MNSETSASGFPWYDSWCHLLFFHCIPLGAGLLDPASWAVIADVPELTELAR